MHVIHIFLLTNKFISIKKCPQFTLWHVEGIHGVTMHTLPIGEYIDSAIIEFGLMSIFILSAAIMKVIETYSRKKESSNGTRSR